MDFAEFLQEVGVSKEQHIIFHPSFRKIRNAFPGITIGGALRTIQESVTPEGSLIMPAFTYSYSKADGSHEIFDRINSISKTGIISEYFRQRPGVVRTCSPTHSFSLWGKIAREISYENNPESPLGKGSVMEWMAVNKNSYVLLAGTDFSSLTFAHYLEVKAPVPWADISPWEFMGVLPEGDSVAGKIKLKELPGCSKSFISFEQYLLRENIIIPFLWKDFRTLFIPVQLLIDEGLHWFRDNYTDLLCPAGTCKACDYRRKKLEIF